MGTQRRSLYERIFAYPARHMQEIDLRDRRGHLRFSNVIQPVFSISPDSPEVSYSEFSVGTINAGAVANDDPTVMLRFESRGSGFPSISYGYIIGVWISLTADARVQMGASTAADLGTEQGIIDRRNVDHTNLRLSNGRMFSAANDAGTIATWIEVLMLANTPTYFPINGKFPLTPSGGISHFRWRAINLGAGSMASSLRWREYS